MGINYEDFLSETAKRIEPMILRESHAKYANSTVDVVSLAPGVPNRECFPMESIVIKLKDGSTLEITGEALYLGQQYTGNAGIKEYEHLRRDLIKTLHQPPCWNKSPDEGQTVVLSTTGATECIMQVTEMILNPKETILVAEQEYTQLLTVLTKNNLQPIPVAIDEHGLVPASLRRVMSRWPPEGKPGVDGKPKLLYMVPNGQNPTGSNITIQRKQEIYKIAQEYNFLIFEDDPYWLIHFEEDKRAASLLSLDTDGRVFRADTFSKSLVPGLRAGLLSGPAPLMTSVYHNLGYIAHGTSPMSQTIILAFFRKWGINGFLEHNRRISQLYRKQRDVMLSAADRWMKDLVEYEIPTCGMFIWMKIIGCVDTLHLLEKAAKKGLLLVPGEFFYAIKGTKSPYLRLSYSLEKPENIDKAMRILGDLIREEVTP